MIRFAPGLAADGSITLLDFVNVALRSAAKLVAISLLIGAMAVAYTYVSPASHVATTRFAVSEQQQNLSIPTGLSGLTRQFGVEVPSSGQYGAEFYEMLLKSPTLNRIMLDRKFAYRGDSMRLLDIMRPEGPSLAGRVTDALELLDAKRRTEIDRLTGTIRLSFSASDPQLATNVAAEYVNQLNQFNTTRRQYASGQKRRFVERRYRVVSAELAAVEDSLRDFKLRNRLALTPALALEEQRLLRRVQLSQQVLIGIATALEEARFAEVNDVPALTVIDTASAPVLRLRKMRAVIAIVATGTAFLVALLILFVSVIVRRHPIAVRGDDFEEFRRHVERLRVGRALKRWTND